ncbi:FadD3 family acyl-CoA ligase [Sphingomonas sp. C3-2]|uniref:FadD3 family acyl-CoA ligase n=1 Tax=Sphingomonas sp. C3-2 TaxID=3062169 RepID=UPI00294B4815|nr:FadD3 family acyl-CoA ligase [Sphingomonas sp. C3-2]WOK37416.1 FadD3 family acyl-CoA ligase [Sphingomonas sp. C3-2]
MSESKFTIPHKILEAARRHGDVEAIRGEDGRRVYYRDLEALVRRAAAGFCAAGLQPGDRVAIWAPNSIEWIIATLGAQAAGGAIVPLNTRLKGREAGYILNTSGAKLLVTVSNFLGMDYPQMLANEDLPNLTGTVLLDGESGGTRWNAFLEAGDAVDQAEVDRRMDGIDENQICDILFTSGTTGNPKGAVTIHGQNVRLYIGYGRTLGMGPDDRYLIINPFFHSFGYKAGWLAAMLAGATVLPHGMFDPNGVLERIEKEKVTILPGPPTIYQSLLAADYTARDISSLRLSMTGAASVPVTLIHEMWEKLGIDLVVTAYGLTETCGTVTMCRADDDAETIANTAGRAVDGVEVKLVDGEGNTVPTGEAGELLVRGDNVMQGYFNDAAATEAAIDADGWLRTGDIAVQDARGNVKITDRAKDIFIVGGFNAYPAEIEGLLAANPVVMQSAVIGVPDERLGEVPKAYVVLRPGASATPAEIIAWCRENMANYKVPRQVEIREALPLNASGKVQKFMLRDENAG